MKPEELDPYSRWQMEKFGDVLPPVNNPLSDDWSTEEEQRFSEWMARGIEQLILKDAEYFGCKQDLNL